MPMSLWRLLLLAIFTLPLFAQQPGFHVGETNRAIHPQRNRNWRGAKTEALLTEIWYPVAATVATTEHDIGTPGNLLFHGGMTAIDAPIASFPERFPLIVLSHGTGGTGNSLEWLAIALAANGYIVAAVNHPGNNALEPLTSDGFRLWWERASDLTDVLDSLLVDPVTGSRIDKNRIGAAGFSLGGYTVIELAGARTNRQAFLDFCNSKQADATCVPPEMARAEAARTSPALPPSPEALKSIAQSAASYRDPRIKAAFAMAPALGEAFTQSDLAAVEIPLEIVVGDGDVTVPFRTNAVRYGQLLPSAKVTILPGGISHYTFTDTCLPAGLEMLAEICKDKPGVDRDEVHRRVSEMALRFFNENL